MSRKSDGLQEVISVLENVDNSGITLNSLKEIICEGYNKTLPNTDKRKILKAVVKGIKKKLITEENGKFRLTSPSDHKRLVPGVNSVPSLMSGGTLCKFRAMKTHSLSSECVKEKRDYKRRKNNYSAKMRKLNNVKNGTKHLSNVNRNLGKQEFTVNDLNIALDAIIQIRHENDRLIQECRNVNKSLKQRYDKLKRLRTRGYRQPNRRESSLPKASKRKRSPNDYKPKKSAKETVDHYIYGGFDMNYNNHHLNKVTEINLDEPPVQVD